MSDLRQRFFIICFGLGIGYTVGLNPQYVSARKVRGLVQRLAIKDKKRRPEPSRTKPKDNPAGPSKQGAPSSREKSLALSSP